MDMNTKAIPYITLLIYTLIGIQLPCSIAQSLPVGTPVLEDSYRRAQLLGKLDSSISFSVRPLHKNALLESGTDGNDQAFAQNNLYSSPSGLNIEVLPIMWQHQITTGFPYGWNDGSMIPNVGYQTQFSAGIYAEYKFLSIQLRPEFVYAQNRYYLGFDGKTKPSWQAWYEFYNNIDMPEHFGEGGYTKLFAGQSSIRFNYKALSAGISTENIWWGPGIRNSLLMSNTAPGFLHATINTTRPIRSNIGSFEGQFIVGKLNESGFTPTRQGFAAHYDEYYIPKPETWRYISGLTIAWQPKWVSGLSVGFAQSFIVNRSDQGKELADYLALPFMGYQSRYNRDDPSKTGTSEQLKKRDAYISFFGRWMMPKGNAEIYFEYGRNDLPWDNRDFMVQIEHSRAYTVGFRKLVPINRESEFIQLALEATQTESSRTKQVRTSPTWYINNTVRHGYTHRGQLLGAGIGPGSNMQSLGVSWVRGVKQLGIQAERLVRLNDFYHRASGDIRRNWVDLGISAVAEWDIGRFIVMGKLNHVHAYNYQYELIEKTNQQSKYDFWRFTPVDNRGFQLQLGTMYRF